MEKILVNEEMLEDLNKLVKPYLKGIEFVADKENPPFVRKYVKHKDNQLLDKLSGFIDSTSEDSNNIIINIIIIYFRFDPMLDIPTEKLFRMVECMGIIKDDLDDSALLSWVLLNGTCVYHHQYLEHIMSTERNKCKSFYDWIEDGHIQ